MLIARTTFANMSLEQRAQNLGAKVALLDRFPSHADIVLQMRQLQALADDALNRGATLELRNAVEYAESIPATGELMPVARVRHRRKLTALVDAMRPQPAPTLPGWEAPTTQPGETPPQDDLQRYLPWAIAAVALVVLLK